MSEEKSSTGEPVLIGPFHALHAGSQNCPKCDAPPSEHHIEDYDMMWHDGNVVCKCGTFVRRYDAG